MKNKWLTGFLFLLVCLSITSSAYSGYEQDRYNPFWRFNESAADPAYNNVGWEAMNSDEKEAWFKHCAGIDITDERAYNYPTWGCRQFSVQTTINFGGAPPDNLPDIYNDPAWSTPNRFNLPLYSVGVYGHAINGILIGDNPLDFSDWYFFEPQTDSRVYPGSMSMPRHDVYIEIPTKLLDSGDYDVIAGVTNLIGWSIRDETPVLKRGYPKDILVLPTNWSAGDDLWETSSNWDNEAPNSHRIAGVNNGGTVRITSRGAYCTGLSLGSLAYQTGNAVLVSGSELNAEKEFIGAGGTGLFTQTGGTNTVAKALYIGFGPGAGGTYDISNGTLNVNGVIAIGPTGGGGGTLMISGAATVQTDTMVVGFGDAPGILLLTRGTPGPVVRENILFAQSARLEVEGTGTKPVIYCRGLDIEATDEQHFDFDQVEIVFNGNAGVPGSPELAGTLELAGAIGAGFADNFALGGLVVSGEFDLSFVDMHDNNNRGLAGKECLFTETIDISSDCSLDLSGYCMYVNGNVEGELDAWIADGRLFSSCGPINAIYDSSNDWMQVVPEPGTMILLGLGGLSFLRRRRQR